PILDREPADPDVAVEPARAAERQAALGGDVACDLAADGHVGPFDRGLDGGAGVDRHVAGGLELTFHGAGDLEVALDVEASLEDVAGPQAHQVGAAVLRGGSSSCGFFGLSHGFLRLVCDICFPIRAMSGDYSRSQDFRELAS